LDAIQVKALKPTGKLLTDFKQIPITEDTVVTAKCDGEFEVIEYENGQATMYNQWGRERTNDLSALAELTEKLSKQNIRSVTLEAECYAVDSSNRMLKLPRFISIIKGYSYDDIEKHIRIAVFDLDQLNGHRVTDTYKWKLGELSNWLGTVNSKSKAYVVPHIFPKSTEEVEQFWREFVEARNYEGLFARINGDFLKIKPKLEVDAVVVGLNKDHDSFKNQEARSLKIALIDEHGYYMVLGDVGSGISRKVGKRLWELTKLGIQDDDKVLWVKPHVVVKVEYEGLYEKQQPKLFPSEETGFYVSGMKENFVSLRHPRLVAFRPDKKPIFQDVPITQVNGR